MNTFLPYQSLDYFIATLADMGYQVIGPQVKAQAIVYGPLEHMNQLPWGYQDIQQAGSTKLVNTSKNEAFLFSNSAQAIKPELFKSKEHLWKVKRDSKGKLVFTPILAEQKKLALFGVRPCDVAAMLIQDQVFDAPPHKDQHYLSRRNSSLVIVVNCGYSAKNCFCISAGFGPKAQQGFDLALTEINKGFVVESKSAIGKEITNKLNLSLVTTKQQTQAREKINQAIKQQDKKLPMANDKTLAKKISDNHDHPHWEDVAQRCLSCSNCTNVCPTCFCHQTVDSIDKDNQVSTHTRLWDSCFNVEHSTMHHATIRETTKERYRQWLTHKLSSWHQQFGQSGCVGCGRCITWCPSNIDLTEEVKKLCK